MLCSPMSVFTFANDVSFSLTYFFAHHLPTLSGNVSHLPSLFYSSVSQNLVILASTNLEYKDLPTCTYKKGGKCWWNILRKVTEYAKE